MVVDAKMGVRTSPNPGHHQDKKLVRVQQQGFFMPEG